MVVDASHRRTGRAVIPMLVGTCVGCAVGVCCVALRPTIAVRTVAVAPAVRGQPARRSSAVVVSASFVALALLAAVTIVAGPVAAAAALVGVVFVRRWRAVRAVASRQRRIDATYPDAIDLVVLAVRAGFLPAAAVAVTMPHMPPDVRPAFEMVTARVANGERFADALAALDALGPLARPLIDSFAAADRYGLALAPVLERLSSDARQQRRRAVDAAARQLPVRLSLPLVLCTLPSFVLLAIVPLLLGAFSSLHTR
jgi:tight adherence protein C